MSLEEQTQRRPGNDDSRARILAAAERAFARDGFAGARTDAMAADAGVNKALLYYYFKSKEALYLAIIEQHLREFQVRALEVLDAPESAGVVLLRYVNLHFDFISRRHRHAPLFQQLMMRGGKPPAQLFRKYMVPRTVALRKLLVRGMREGDFRPMDPFHAAISIAALIVFYFSAAPVLQLLGYSDPYTRANLRRRKEHVLALVRQGFFATP